MPCLRSLLLALVAGSTAGAAMAQTPSPAPAKVRASAPHDVLVFAGQSGMPAPRPDVVFVAHDAPAKIATKIEREKRAFLGVETAPVRGALAAQLGLPEGVGLVVDSVVPESPAAGTLEQHDVLVKFEDQLLIEPRQLAVLIRQKKDGDSVKLTLRRAGKEEVVTVKLTERELPRLSWRFEDHGPFRVPLPTEEGLRHFGARTREEVADVITTMREEWPKVRTRIIERFGADEHPRDVHTTRIELGHGLLTYSDDEGSLEVKHDDGKRVLTAKDAAGKEVFSGPINTPEERAKIPPAVLPRLEKLESQHGVSFDFEAPLPEPELRELRGGGVTLRGGQLAPAPAPAVSPSTWVL